jgi:hypothetical protein
MRMAEAIAPVVCVGEYVPIISPTALDTSRYDLPEISPALICVDICLISFVRFSTKSWVNDPAWGSHICGDR